MQNRRWTILVVPSGSAATRRFELSGTALKLLSTVVAAAVVVACVLTYATVARTVDLARASSVERENAALARDLSLLQGRLSVLEDTLSSLARRDARYRVMANLDPLDPEVLAAGIGGPKPASAESPTSVLTERSEAVRVDLDALIRRANLLTSSFAEAADSLEAHTDRLASTPSIMPTQGWLSSQYSGNRFHPILHIGRPHPGIDVSAPTGTPIDAPAKGTVTSAGWTNGYGYMVTIDHGYGVVTKFAHASRVLVRAGQKVVRGQRIALVGSTGLSVAPHLHYEIEVNGRRVNPLRYILPDALVD